MPNSSRPRNASVAPKTTSFAAVLARLEEQFAAQTEFSDEQIARMKHSIAQLDQGEIVTSEQVDSFFADWRKDLENR
jgi:hypothetical protein